ncbi:hypothetical protein SAMN05421820_11135 [Pedobacter steynii]|uniref:Uncharacterized protein n=1 Tax=Pedobacter steynii TaxID=430522 RepID=A0A1H0G416_9SPHI|nr:hypothetical protein [Pedobacter steynii]NQX42315.1 hypothetical protein [Pedobacter steynii]SDO01645.1 hypothetical protein SAMN05421820_11135 [Pedobacter steynii]
MKPLLKLNTKEKAKLLHLLFPNEIPEFLNHLQKFCTQLHERQEGYEKLWNPRLMHFERWRVTSGYILQLLENKRPKLESSSEAFASHLFFLDYATITVNQLSKYAETGCYNQRFKLAVPMFFPNYC